jgi:hypothetical protein
MCSNGKMWLAPASGNNAMNGVLNLKISAKIAGSDALAIQNILVTATNVALGTTDIRKAANHVLFCLPNDKSMESVVDIW